MKLWSFAIFASFTFAPSFAAAETTPTPSKPAAASTKGFINIVCNPSCDDVVIAGRSYGPSPVVRAELPAGTHEVTLKRKAQADKRTQITVVAGQVSSHDFKLVNQAPPTAPPPPEVAARVAKFARTVDGWISVQCDPGCDEVIVGGKSFTGKTLSNIPLPPGTHEVTAKRKGAPDKIIKVRVVDGQTTAMRIHMQAEAPAPAPKK